MSLDIGLRRHDTFNVTHNLTPMWIKANIYECLYKSEGKKAKEIINQLEKGLQDIKDNYNEYKKLNPSNGWGDIDGAIEFLERVIKEFKQYPNAKIEVWK